MKLQDTLEPYQEIERDPIQYTYCRDYDHISRYKGLRQVIHQGQSSDRFVALETVNPFSSTTDVTYFTVPSHLENRLDIIAKEKLGSAKYAWVIAYFNNIQDGYTCLEGTVLTIPKSVSSLFDAGEILSPVSAVRLNLGTE